MKFPQEYLGDAVYASFDGYQVWLHVGRHDAEPVVALEPAVLDALNRYYALVTQPTTPIPDRRRQVSTIKLEKCAHCKGSGRPGGLHAPCAYCGGDGYVPRDAASPSPASPADDVAGLIERAKVEAQAFYSPTNHDTLLDLAAALSRLQARLAEVTAELDFERGERRRVSDLCDETEHERAVAEASAATMREALTAAREALKVAREYVETEWLINHDADSAAAMAQIDAALGGQHG
jgi:hypothetical protein